MSNDFYSSLSRRSEVDMRQEMNNFLDGSYPEIAKKQKAVLRKMRRDSSGDLTECECVDDTTKEPDVDVFCPYCQNEGYYWDESFIDVYRIIVRSDVGNSTRENLIDPTLLNIAIVVFFMRSTVDVTEADKIVELVLDTEGVPIKPYKRKAIYRINTTFPFRADKGRLEYWKVGTFEEKRKFLNGPQG